MCVHLCVGLWDLGCAPPQQCSPVFSRGWKNHGKKTEKTIPGKIGFGLHCIVHHQAAMFIVDHLLDGAQCDDVSLDVNVHLLMF